MYIYMDCKRNPRNTAQDWQSNTWVDDVRGTLVGARWRKVRAQVMATKLHVWGPVQIGLSMLSTAPSLGELLPQTLQRRIRTISPIRTGRTPMVGGPTR